MPESQPVEAAEKQSSAPVALVVLNERAGTVAKAVDMEFRVRAAFAKAGSDVRCLLLQPAAIEDAVRNAAERGAAVVYVGGGDGTLGTAARRLAGTRTALGVLPLGTRNHFARDLGIPLDVDAAVEALLDGRQTAVDLGEVNGIAFINNASLGFYPRAVKRRARHQSQLGMSKLRAMLHAGLHVFWRLPLQRIRVRWEDREEVLSSPLVFVGNNEYSLSPDSLGRRATLSGGRLGTYYARSVGRFRLLWAAIRAVFGRVEEVPDLEKLSTPTLVVESRRKRIDVAIDGEVHALETPLEFRILCGALRVLVPRDRP